MINFFLAIQFFTDVDECTHNLHNCAPNMTLVHVSMSMARSSAKVCPIHSLIIPMSLLSCLLLRCFYRFLHLELNCQLSGALHGFIKFGVLLSVLNIIWRSIACVGSEFVRRHVGYCMAKQRYRGEPATAGGQPARGLKRDSCEFPIPSPAASPRNAESALGQRYKLQYGNDRRDFEYYHEQKGKEKWKSAAKVRRNVN